LSDIFLSYNRDNQATARRFAEAFEHAGFSVWWDQTLNAGEDYDKVTEKALEDAKAVVVLWSRKSVDSRWVRAEATQADRNGTLVPAMIEACKRPIMFELKQTADLSSWNGDPDNPAWQSYLASVRRLVQKDALSAAVAPPTANRPRRNHLPKIAIAVALLLVAGATVWSVDRNRKNAATAPSGNVATPGAAQTSIAVMPFSNLTGDASKDYLGDGMAEELINVLTKVPGLSVSSRTSSFAYKGRNTDLRQISKDLGVGTILEGSVRSAGETLRVTAQLIDAATDRHLWSQTYDRKFIDLFKLQDDLAREIVTAFKTTMHANLPAFESQAPPTKSLEAYTLYLQAYAAVGSGTAEGRRRALDFLDQSIARDPDFARSYRLRAVNRWTSGAPITDVEADARRAVALDPAVGAQANLGVVEASRRNYVAAEKRFQEAYVVNPKETDTFATHVIAVLLPAGHIKEALQKQIESYRLAPALPLRPLSLSRIYLSLGLDAEAIRYADLAITLGLNPNAGRIPNTRSDVAARAGHYSEAGGIEAVKLIYAALGDSSRKQDAAAALRRTLLKLDQPADGDFRIWSIAWYSQLGALDQAYEIGNQLQRQYEPQTPAAAWSWLWTPEMRAFRQDSRFPAFMTRLGMMPYWKEYGPPDDCDLKDGKLTCR